MNLPGDAACLHLCRSLKTQVGKLQWSGLSASTLGRYRPNLQDIYSHVNGHKAIAVIK